MSKKYFGEFRNRADILEAFLEPSKSMPKAKDIIFAFYGQNAYGGTAQVVFRRGRALYEVKTSHGVEFGLENMWIPLATTWQLLERQANIPALARIVDRHVKKLARESS